MGAVRRATSEISIGPLPPFFFQPFALIYISGVSYVNLSIGSDSVKWIQKWPGRSQANENKVPTVVVYPKDQSVPCSWGFLSETVSEQTSADKEYKGWFKTYLDPLRLIQAQFEDRGGTPKSNAEVEKCYEDYLRMLHRHVEFKLGPEIQGATWQNAKVEFIFGVPTTWKPTVVETFRTVIQRAGFGSWPDHTVTMGLTEAEAAAVHTSIEASGIFKVRKCGSSRTRRPARSDTGSQERDVLLVCDAGGGTTVRSKTFAALLFRNADHSSSISGSFCSTCDRHQKPSPIPGTARCCLWWVYLAPLLFIYHSV